MVLSPLPESDGGNAPHQGVGGDALQVEQAAVKQQQQDYVLTEQEPLPSFSHSWKILEGRKQRAAAFNSQMLNITEIKAFLF